MKLVLNTLIALFIFVASAQNNTTYWQQKVDYKMEIDMDVENHQYKGTQELTYTNNSPDTITINSISSPQFNIVEIHETIMNNGIASMIKINTLTILEKQSVSLKPGGKHLMLIDPVKRISEGEEIRLIFELSNNETMTLNTTAVSRF